MEIKIKEYSKSLVLVAVVIIWLVSIFAVNGSGVLVRGIVEPNNWGELATILFGAASIALFLFSIIIGLLAVVGWKTLQDDIGKKVTEKVAKESAEKFASIKGDFEAIKERTKSLEQELKGRTIVTQAYVLGQLSIPRGELYASDPQSRQRLMEAVKLTKQAYDLLHKIEERGEYMALNNLVSFSCFLELEEVAVLKYARRLLVMGMKKDSVDLQLTACRAILQYKAGSRKEARARGILRSLISDPNATQMHKDEAEFYLKSFPESIVENDKPSPDTLTS